MIKIQKMSETEKKLMELIWNAEDLPVTASEVQQLAGSIKDGSIPQLQLFCKTFVRKEFCRVVKRVIPICIIRKLQRTSIYILRQSPFFKRCIMARCKVS